MLYVFVTFQIVENPIQLRIIPNRWESYLRIYKSEKVKENDCI